MTSEARAEVKPAQEEWHVAVAYRRSRVEGFGSHASPMLARVAGIAWVEQVWRDRPLDWVAPNREVAIAYWGDQPLATVTVWRG